MTAVIPEIVGRNVEVTADIRQLIETKLGRVEDRLIHDVVSARVMLHVEKYLYSCEILIVGKDHDVKAVEESQVSMVDAINAAIDHARRQALKNREKTRDHHRGEGTVVSEDAESVA
jgi:putative sigma-54 modulation protein